MTAPLLVTTMPRLAPGFSGEAPSRCWVTRCRVCGTSRRHTPIVMRSAAMNRPGWLLCMAAARSHIKEHEEGGRL